MQLLEFLRLVLLGIFIVGSTASLLSLCYYIFLAVRGTCPAVLSIDSGYYLDWKNKVFFVLAAIGFLVSMHQGATAMLYWMPDSWGWLDDANDYVTLRWQIALMFTTFGGSALIYIIDRAMKDRIHLRALDDRIANEKKIRLATSVSQLEGVKAEFEIRVAELKNMFSNYAVGEEPFSIETLQLSVYNELIHIVDKKIGQMRRRD